MELRGFVSVHGQENWVIDFSGSSDGESGSVCISARRRPLSLEKVPSYPARNFLNGIFQLRNM